MGLFECSRVRPLRLFEVLARNRQSALGRVRRSRSAREQPPRMFTIPPRQQLSSPRRLAIRGWNFTHIIVIITRPKARNTIYNNRTYKNSRSTLFHLGVCLDASRQNSTKRREKKKSHDTNTKKKLKKRKKKRRKTDDFFSRFLLFAITPRARFLLERTLTRRKDL